ncbi:MAG TPA: hypothetical protein VHA35_12700 [Dongiaceae bacterium]|nr:hypothetical protein [Dongiaceae bacterium]
MATERNIAEMSEKELRAELFKKTGLPVPREMAGREDWERWSEEWRQWLVAAVFIRTRKLAAAEDPPIDSAEADAVAAEFLRRDPDAKQLEPYILQALGERASKRSAVA